MGDKPMNIRTLGIIVFVLLSFSPFAIADLSVKQIERMVEQIHLKRPGISLDKLEQTKEPFIVFKKEEDEDKKTVVKVVLKKEENEDSSLFALHALMNGKAFINDKWRKKGDMVLGYKIEYIGKRGVVLRKENRIKTLFLPAKKADFITLDEGV
jgi:hypothetical protein